MDQSFVELNQKIDALTTQVAYLTEQAQVAQRQRQERAELISDLTPIANQAFELSIQQLEEIQEYVDLSDLLRLFKRLLRNGRNLEKMLDQLESLSDLVETMSPMADEMFCKVVASLADLEQKGYFAFARDARRITDHLVASFTGQELQSVDISYAGLLRQLRDPQVRRGLALMLRLLQIVGAQVPGNGSITENQPGKEA